MADGIMTEFQAVMCTTETPFRYLVELWMEGVPTGISTFVWGKKRAQRVMRDFIDRAEELLNNSGMTNAVIDKVLAKRRQEEMARVQVGDSVKLLVDIGSIKKGRVCRVVEVVEPTAYVARGGKPWDDGRYPIKVVPVATPSDTVPLGPKDALPLMRGEFGPISEEVDD